MGTLNSSGSGSLIPFSFEGTAVRAVVIGGEPHLVGKDVCDRLGYANSADAMTKHCKGVANRYPLQTTGGVQELRILGEADVLRLIVASRLPAAERFERWVFEDVLPTIRRTGGYGAIDVRDPRQLTVIAQQLIGVNTELQDQVAVLAPKAAAMDRLEAAEGSLCIRDTAKTLGVQEKRLIRWLSANGWIYRRLGNAEWVGYQAKLVNGMLDHRPVQYGKPGEDRVRTQVVVTAKGLARLAKLLSGDLGPA